MERTYSRSCGKRAIQNSSHHSNEVVWPWNAAIYHLSNKARTNRCTGTLIHSSIVLTAARCVFRNNNKISARRVRVQLGKNNLKDYGSNVQDFQVIDFYICVMCVFSK